MIAVIFELWPGAEPDQQARYFALATELHAELADVDGFISIERFQSLTTQGKFLSLSFWRDENAVATWRNGVKHRAAQTEGRDGVLGDYRLRVAQVLRDYGMRDRTQVPLDSLVHHSP